MAIIDNNHVSVTLIPEDMKALGLITHDSPLQRIVRPEDMQCSIIYAKAPITGFVPKPDVIYSTVVTGAQIWYDPVIKSRDLVVTLDAPSIVERRNEIMKTHNAEPTDDVHFFPHITLVYSMPDYAHNYKWWINLILETFNVRFKDVVIRFSNESIGATELGFSKSGETNTDQARIANDIITKSK